MHEVCTYLVLESSMYVLTFTCGLCRSIFHGFFLGPPVCFLQFCMVLPSFLHSLPQTTIFCTNESTKKHDLDHDFRTKESTARRRATQTTFFARRRIQKSMISSTVFGTRESTEKHNCFTKESTKQHDFCTMQEEHTKRSKKHNLLHEGGHQKARSRARFWHEGEHQKAHLFQKESTKKHDFCTMQEGAHQKDPKSTICCMKEDIKKHDLEHDFWHEEEHQKARRTTPKSTI